MSNTAIVAYVVIALGIGYAFILPNYNDLTLLMEEQQKYEHSLEMVNNIENRKNELLAKFNNISAQDRKDIETVLPSSFNYIRLISQIDAVAARYGISIDRVTSREVDSSNGDSIAGAMPPKPYKSAIIGFAFDATYDKFGGFLSELEDSMRILDIQSINLSAGETGVYTYDVEFQTYWLP